SFPSWLQENTHKLFRRSRLRGFMLSFRGAFGFGRHWRDWLNSLGKRNRIGDMTHPWRCRLNEPTTPSDQGKTNHPFVHRARHADSSCLRQSTITVSAISAVRCFGIAIESDRHVSTS